MAGELGKDKKVTINGKTFERKIKVRKDHGRPKGNQAGLPPTKGLKSREDKGPDQRGMRFNFPSGPQTIFSGQQKAEERELIRSNEEQRILGEQFEEQASEEARNDTLLRQIVDGLPQRRAENRYKKRLSQNLDVDQDQI